MCVASTDLVAAQRTRLLNVLCWSCATELHYAERFSRSNARLAHDQDAVGFLMKVVEEIVAARLQRPQADRALTVSGHHFFHAQADTFELHWSRIEVLHVQLDGHFGRRMN